MTKTSSLLTRPFDAHNHIHMGPSDPLRALVFVDTRKPDDDEDDDTRSSDTKKLRPLSGLSGLALMSTHPRDYPRIEQLVQTLPALVRGPLHVVPCFGVHPWFLHELTEHDWQLLKKNDADDDDIMKPRWVHQLEQRLIQHSNSIVGEIGLDGFHFAVDEATGTQQLTCPMDRQVRAMILQLDLACRYQLPVSLHAVQCWGPMMETLSSAKQLPPKIYFHAFGGKLGTVDQIMALCRKKSAQVYFGFAPVINFRAGKTADVARKVGLDRILLETDHEDAMLVPESVQEGVTFLAQVFQLSQSEIVQKTTSNALQFYGIHSIMP